MGRQCHIIYTVYWELCYVHRTLAVWPFVDTLRQARSQGGGARAAPPPATPVSPLEQKISHLSLIVQWPCPLIDRLSGLLRKIELLWDVLWASNMPKMHWRPGLRPRPQWGSSRHQSQCPTPSAPSAPRCSCPTWKPGAPADLELATVLRCAGMDRYKIPAKTAV